MLVNVEHISKNFLNKEAIKDININIEAGTILGLIGPNGAGKSTLIKCIMDIYIPDSGIVKIQGENIQDNSTMKSIIGYVGDRNDFFNSYKIKEIIKYYKLAYESFDENRFKELNNIFVIPLQQKLSKLSKGNAARVHFMLALSIRPQLLVLDEPTSGLDPLVKRKFLRVLMEEVSERKTSIIISSHNLSDLESICDRVIFLDNGSIIKDNSIDELKTSMKKLQIIFKMDAPEDFQAWSEFISFEKFGKSYNVITTDFNDALTSKLKVAGAMFIEELPLSLEDMLIYTLEGNGNNYE